MRKRSIRVLQAHTHRCHWNAQAATRIRLGGDVRVRTLCLDVQLRSRMLMPRVIGRSSSVGFVELATGVSSMSAVKALCRSLFPDATDLSLQSSRGSIWRFHCSFSSLISSPRASSEIRGQSSASFSSACCPVPSIKSTPFMLLSVND